MTDPDAKTLTGPAENLLSAPGARRASLIVLAGPGLGKMFRVDKAEMVLGRSSKGDIWLDDESISRQHAKLIRRDGDVVLVDLGSKNGTFCNGAQVKELTRLKDGDKIQLGSRTVLKFSLHDDLDDHAQQNLYNSAVRDALTGAFNKGFLLESLRKDFAFAQRHRQPLSLLMLDVDNFKSVNDTHGHPAGDYVLINLVVHLGETVRAEDILARFGGEEFVLLLKGVSEDVAVAIADRLRRQIADRTLMFNQTPLRVTVSIGVAAFDGGPAKDADELLAIADQYLYKAKAQGRNCVASACLEPPKS